MTEPYRAMVCGFAFSDDRRHVLLIRKKTGPRWMIDKWNGLGGKVEADDSTPHYAMAREFYEESGLGTRPDDWRRYLSMTFNGGRVDFFEHSGFPHGALRLARNLEGKGETLNVFPVLDITCDRVEVVENLRWHLPMALDRTIRDGIVRLQP